MDFASLMKSKMAASSAAKPDDSGKTYLKRSELEAQRQANYLREQDELEQKRLARLEKKRKFDEEEAERNRTREEKKRRLAEESKKRRAEEEEAEEQARRKRLGLPELAKPATTPTDETPSTQDEDDIPAAELLTKLQHLGEPRFLFAETHPQRLRRYRKLTAQALAPQLSSGPIPTSLALVPEADMKLPDALPADAAGLLLVRRQIASYFDMLLAAWQAALARRARDVQVSSAGKQAHSSFVAARENLRPLFRKLETGDFPPRLLDAVVEIVQLAQARRYVAANDAYLRLSIGKAAWPIGVTMVGIHERSAREKLHETEKTGTLAHIMSDEVTRKMLQGIKRCLSYAQTRWPPEDLGQLMG